MTAASSGLSANAHLSQRWSGVTGLSLLKALDQELDSEANLQKLAAQLKKYITVLSAPPVFVGGRGGASR